MLSPCCLRAAKPRGHVGYKGFRASFMQPGRKGPGFLCALQGLARKVEQVATVGRGSPAQENSPSSTHPGCHMDPATRPRQDTHPAGPWLGPLLKLLLFTWN